MSLESGQRKNRLAPGALVAALVYLSLSFMTVTSVGVVGEVAQTWTTGAPPAVLVQTDPETWADGARAPTAGHRLGPLVASQARPVERLVVGTLSLPVAVNGHTGALVDWPARALWALTGAHGVVVAWHVVLGLIVVALVYRQAREHASALTATVAALLVATDWSFVFYKKVLGATEVSLQIAVLLCLWAIWSRAPGPVGRRALLAMGIALGLHAKLSFGISLGALALVGALMGWPGGAPSRRGASRVGIPVALAVLPLLVAVAHRAAVPAPRVISHDFAGAQLQRILGALSGPVATREQLWSNLSAWAGAPLGFFERAYGATGAPSWSMGQALTWAILFAGVTLAWRDRRAPQGSEQSSALLRFCSVLLLVQVGALLLLARDLHHLAMATPVRALATALAIGRLAAFLRGPYRLQLILALPALVSGVRALALTDAVVQTVPVASFTASGQAAMARLLREHQVQRLVGCDYEWTGVIEVIAPDIRVEWVWGEASRVRGDALGPWLHRAAGGHLLVARASAPLVFNLAPSPARLEQVAGAQGLEIHEVGRLEDEAAVLYRVVRP